MRIIKFSKEYIKAEQLGASNARKIHGLIDSSRSYTMCGFGIETDLEKASKITCPDCIAIIKECKKLKQGKDY